MDESLKHFPIKDFNRIRAMRPSTIEPLELVVEEKSFSVLLYEDGDEQELPLLRIEVRLKKDDPDGQEGPVKMIWNSTLKIFKLVVVGIDEAIDGEKERFLQARELELQRRQAAQAESNPEQSQQLTPEERIQRKEEKRRLYEERVQQEQLEMGMAKWKEEQRKKLDAHYQQKRLKTLAKLSETGKLIIDGNVGMDVDVAHLGWFGILSPRATMIKAFAPNTGVRVSCHPSLALPKKWGSYNLPKDDSKTEETEEEQQARDEDFKFEDDPQGEGNYLDDSFDDDFDDDDDVREDFDEEAFADDMFGYDPLGEYADYKELREEEANATPNFRYVRGSKNPYGNDGSEEEDNTAKHPWEKYSGRNVGWQYDEDLRFSKNTKLKEGWNPIPKEKPWESA